MSPSEFRALLEAASPRPWRREPLTYWNDRGKNENHNWNLLGGAETAEGYALGSSGRDKTKPWGGTVRTEPQYIALPDAEAIVATMNRAELFAELWEASEALAAFNAKHIEEQKKLDVLEGFETTESPLVVALREVLAKLDACP